MRSVEVAVTAVVSVFALSVGVARADPPWSAPAPITPGDLSFWQPALTFTNDGHALATLTDGGGGPTRVLAAAPGATAFTEVGRATLVAAPAVYGRRGAAYLRRPSPRPRERLRTLSVSLGTVPGSLGHVQPLARVDVSRSGAISARLAADPSGNVAAVWLEPRRPPRAGDATPRLRVRIALRRPGQTFGRPTTIGEAVEYTEGGNLLDAAYGANGDLVVTFQRTHARAVSQRTLELAARVKRHGHRFGRLQTLGPSVGSSSIATAVSPAGAAVVAWGTQDGGEGVEQPWAVRAATLGSRAGRFAKAQLLDPGLAARSVGPVSAAIGRDGTATVAWSGIRRSTRGTYPVRVATTDASGRFGAPAELASNGVARGVVTAADGATTVLWGPLTDPEAESVDAIVASRRAPGAAAFAAPEPLTLGELAVNDAALALDPRTQRPAALWLGAPGTPPGRPLDGVALAPLFSMRGA
jgi:hypothetical protein